MKQLRKILFYFFLSLYVFLCPLTILYALGYLYRPGSEAGIVKTGVIHLATSPPGATVYVGGKRFTGKTPATLHNLLPGPYPVKVVLRNHRPWSKTVLVESEKATVFDRILLYPASWKHRVLLAAPFRELTALPDTRLLLLKKGPKVKDLFLYDRRRQKLRRLLPSRSLFGEAKVLARFLMRGSSRILLHVDFRGAEKFLWLDPGKKGSRVEDVTLLFPAKPRHVEWDPRLKGLIFSVQDQSLSRLEILAKSVEPGFLEGLRGFGLFDREVYFLASDRTFRKMDPEGKNEELLLGDPTLSRSLFAGKYYQVRGLSKELFVFLGEGGDLLASRPPYRFVEKGVLGMEFEPQGKRLLLWTSGKIGVLDFSEEPGGKEIFEKGPGLRWIFEEGRRIEQAFWVYEGSHIVFREGDRVFLLEGEGSGKASALPLDQIREGSSIHYSEESGQLYYLEHPSGRLASIEILPSREILPLPEL